MPEIAVAVAAHDRPLRLRWLLNALEDQTLDRARFEVVVVHDSRGEGPERVLRDHPLVAAGVLRHERLKPGTGSIPRQRNLAWRATGAPLVAFTDDDCRPAPEWLARLLAAAGHAPGAVLQGTTRPDPAELELVRRAPWARTMSVDPGGAWGQACNIAYPRELLERAGGFDEALTIVGEDADLLQRTLREGARLVAVPEALVAHAVHDGTLVATLRGQARWADVALVVRRHPGLRSAMPVRLFWKRRHATFALAAAGTLTGRPLVGAALALPWARDALPAYGSGARGRARAVAELPGRGLSDAAEIAALVRGSLRHRTVLL